MINTKAAQARLNKYRKVGNSGNGLLHGKSIPAQVCAKTAANANGSHKQTGTQHAQQRLAKAKSQKIKPSTNDVVSFYSTSDVIKAAVKKSYIPDNLPETDICAVRSIALVTDKTPEEVWTYAKQYWRDGGRLKSGLTPVNQHSILKDMGFLSKEDYNYTKYDFKTGKMKTKSVGQVLDELKDKHNNVGYILHVPNHVIGVKNGKLIDTANTSDRVKIRGITVVTKNNEQIEASASDIRIELTEKPEKIIEPFGGQTNTLYKFAIFKTGERLNCLLTIVVESSAPTKGYFIIDGVEKNNLGTSGLRQVFRLVKSKYPKLKQLYGTRVTGAKKLSGKQDRSVVYDLTKL